MKENTVIVKWRAGLHSRPASELVKLSNKFKSKITIKKDNMEVDAKSVLGIMTLCATYKTRLSIIIDGADEAEASTALTKLFDEDLDND